MSSKPLTKEEKMKRAFKRFKKAYFKGRETFTGLELEVCRIKFMAQQKL